MAHGGKRPGSGRKPGATTKKTREIADKAAQEGITPLEVMIDNMRFAHEKAEVALAKLFELSSDEPDVAQEAAKEFKTVMGFRRMAQDSARDAAPYMHPRLAAVEHTGEDGGPIMIVSGVPRAND